LNGTILPFEKRYTGTCLIPVAQVGCESRSQQLTFKPYPGPNGQRAYQIRHSDQCLSVDFGAPDTQIQLPNDKYASKITWLPCNNTNGYEGTWIPELATNTNGLDWYIMMPVDNRPGINDPCLNFNTNPASTQMLIEYTCHRNTNSTEEHWARQETYWTPPTTTVTVTTTTTAPVSSPEEPEQRRQRQQHQAGYPLEHTQSKTEPTHRSNNSSTATSPASPPTPTPTRCFPNQLNAWTSNPSKPQADSDSNTYSNHQHA
jgi:hypothetical protein